MRAYRPVIAVTLAAGLVSGVICLSNRSGDRTKHLPHSQAAATRDESSAVEARGARTTSIASFPDRGQLFGYDTDRRVVRSGASTWHPVEISEAHAYRAIAEGGMTLRTPNGEDIQLRYERHVEHPDGSWTWIGRKKGAVQGTEAVLTFGERAVFGTIGDAPGELRLTTEAGSTWLVETDHRRTIGKRLANSDEDFLVPAGLPAPTAHANAAGADSAHGTLIAKAADSSTVLSASGQAADATPLATVDVVVGFTSGFATRLGGDSEARTRLNHLVAVTNTAYLASGLNAQIRVVYAQQIDYPDATHNRIALFDLTGVNCAEQANGSRYTSTARWSCTSVAQSVALQSLTAARETFGADLMVLLRKFEAPEQASCGSAWMLGGGQNPLDLGSAAFGMSIVSDSSADQFPDEGATCPEIMLAHELGHNMGQQHDVVTSRGSDDSDNNGNLLDPEEFGRHPYSFGYSTDGTGSDIATIMSTRRVSQTRYRVFSSPLITSCGGAPCGIAEQTDNVRSMMETMPIVAQFRNRAQRDLNADGRSDLVWHHAGTNQLYYWAMNGAAIIGGDGKTLPPGYASLAMGDMNGDGRADTVISNGHDLRLIPATSSGALGTSVAITGYPSGWTLVGSGDLNADGKSDLVWQNTDTSQLYYWAMNGAVIAGGAGKTLPPGYTTRAISDLNGDARVDVVISNGHDLRLIPMTAANGFGVSQAITGYPVGWTLIGAADVSGDGLGDLIWHNTATNQVYYWAMNAGAVVGGSGKVLPPGYTVPALGDLTGDGRADLVISNGRDLRLIPTSTSGTLGTSVAITGYPVGWTLL
jgi:peptidyl-Asp metalloendopeptidase